MINSFINPKKVRNLGADETAMLSKLLDVLIGTSIKNTTKERYYEGRIPLSEVNLGIALPRSFSGLEIGCAWGAKTVDVLAGRSMFDGFVNESGVELDELKQIVLDNNLVAEYPKACRDELKIGCSFATLSADDKIGCKIRFHSANTATAIWDGALGRISCGLAIIDTAPE